MAVLVQQTLGTAHAAAGPLDERIGGTVAAFEAKYGSATNSPGNDVADIRSYSNRNYKNFSAQAMDGYVYWVSFDLPDAASWTTGKASKIAKRFMPADATCDDAPAAVKNVITVDCKSTALTAIMFPADYARAKRSGEAGSLSFTLTLNANKKSRVAHIDAVIGTDEASETVAATDPIQAPKADTGSSVCGTAYLTSVGGDINLLDSSFDSMQILFVNISAYDLLDPNWVASFAVVLGTWQYVYTDSANRVVPAQCSYLNSLWVDVTWNLNEAATWYAYSVDNLDADAFALGTSYLEAANDALDLFTPVFLSALSGSSNSSSL